MPIHWLVYVLAYLNFKAVLALPKTAGSAQTHKSISFIWIVWSTLYVYLCTKGQVNWLQRRNLAAWFLPYTGLSFYFFQSCGTLFWIMNMKRSSPLFEIEDIPSRIKMLSTVSWVINGWWHVNRLHDRLSCKSVFR